MHSLVATIAAAALLLGCASTLPQRDAGGRIPTSDALGFYQAYEAALRAHQRAALAGFYHPDGALLVINGSRRERTSAGIDSMYRGQWQGPQFFAFDSLRFDAMGPDRVLVTGGFRWLPPESADTGRYIYLSILERTPDGLKIRVEHETNRPGQ